MSIDDPAKGDKGDPGKQGVPGIPGKQGIPGEQGIPGTRNGGIEVEIHTLATIVTDLNAGVHSLADRLRLTKWALIVLALIVAVLIVLGWQVRAVQDDLGVAQDNLRASSCDTAALWLSLLDLPQPEPDPPLTPEEQAQADAALAEFKAKYTKVYEDLACAELER